MSKSTTTLSNLEARRIALASQGFGVARPSKQPGISDLRRLASRLHAIQIDSVNVLVRAHYMPAFSRLGPYPRGTLDEMVYNKRELFEYIAHAASFIPMSYYKLLRWRMERNSTVLWGTASDRPNVSHVNSILEEVAERGPISASELKDPGKGKGSWWGWSEGKRALEWLWFSGRVAIAGRRNFERLYDLSERVIPPAIFKEPSPSPDDARRDLIVYAAKAMGVATEKDLGKYFHLNAWWERDTSDGKREPSDLRRLVSSLVEDGRLERVAVEGWRQPAYMHPSAKVPSVVRARALVSPFDSLIWERDRTARLFDFNYTIEIYVPAPKRVYGYYVLPFLLGESFVGRVDLKSDRKTQTLLVPAAHSEPGTNARLVAAELAEELKSMATWLGLDRIEVGDRGDLARPLRSALRTRKQARHPRP